MDENLLFKELIGMVHDGELLASCHVCGSFLGLEELRDMKCDQCKKALAYPTVDFRRTELLPKC